MCWGIMNVYVGHMERSLLSGCQKLDAELSAVRKFVAFNSRAGFVAHAIPKGWWSLHFSFGLEGLDVLVGTCRRVRS